jgi:hypothetical protein
MHFCALPPPMTYLVLQSVKTRPGVPPHLMLSRAPAVAVIRCCVLPLPLP